MRPSKTLADSPAGQPVIIAEVTGGRALVMRLASLGFTPGTQLLPVRNWGVGPVIVLVRDTRVALGRAEAFSIHLISEVDTAVVQPAAEDPHSSGDGR
jgi:ferrous iron transport protein A